MVVVPTLWWKGSLKAVYAEQIAALGGNLDTASTKNDGSLFVHMPESVTAEDIEATGLFVLSQDKTRKGWHIVSEAGMTFAAENHPQSNPATPKSESKRELSPEEKARNERNKSLRERLQDIADAQNAQDTNQDTPQD